MSGARILHRPSFCGGRCVGILPIRRLRFLWVASPARQPAPPATLSACGGVLLAAQSACEAAQCPPQVEEGLLHAVLVLADHAGALVEPDACAPLL